MPDYRAYVLGRPGHRFLKVTEFSSDHADDVAALSEAKKLIDGYDVELWDGGRLIARLNADGDRSDDDFLKLIKSDSKE